MPKVIYDGSAMDHEWIPPKRVYAASGDLVKVEPGEMRRFAMEPYRLGGVEFPKGSPVDVDERLAKQALAKGCFSLAEGEAPPADEPKKPKRAAPIKKKIRRKKA